MCPLHQRCGKEFLRALVQRLEIALACAAALGLPADRVGQRFVCILPGHAEVRPSASLHWDPKTGALQYHDWHARDGVPWYTLPDVRASLASRQAVRLRGPSVATWQLRLLVEAGVLERYPVPARALPSDMPPAVHKVYDGFVFLLGCKWWHTPHAPAPFAWRFAAVWCGLGTRQAGARHALAAGAWLAPAGGHASADGVVSARGGTRASSDRRSAVMLLWVHEPCPLVGTPTLGPIGWVRDVASYRSEPFPPPSSRG